MTIKERLLSLHDNTYVTLTFTNGTKYFEYVRNLKLETRIFGLKSFSKCCELCGNWNFRAKYYEDVDRTMCKDCRYKTRFIGRFKK